MFLNVSKAFISLYKQLFGWSDGMLVLHKVFLKGVSANLKKF